LPDRPAEYLAFGGDRVTIGAMHELTLPEQKRLREMLIALIPWRKGPFRFFGIDIDAEWRSDLKWNRIIELGRPTLRGRRILDVGANNLYYVYRMAAAEPEFVLGIDPMPRYHFHAELQRRFVPDLPVAFELFGIEDLAPYKRFFDIVFCMGILYHRRNPIESLEQLAHVLKPGGELFLEGVTINGTGSYCLLPEERYMKARGYWFIPTAQAFLNMVRRAPFTDVELLVEHKLGFEEQRRTAWSIYESLEHFLDAADTSRTVEGYPAPNRAYIRAIRK
jgi:tRNA (mo5U34)-methyltransferase